MLFEFDTSLGGMWCQSLLLFTFCKNGDKCSETLLVNIMMSVAYVKMRGEVHVYMKGRACLC